LLECCSAVLSWPSEWPFFIVAVAFQCSFSHGNKKKNRKFTNLENMAYVAIQWFAVLTEILWQIVMYVAAHCHAGGTTFMLPTPRGKFCHINIAVHLCRRRGLQFETELAVYSRTVCNTSILRIFQTNVVVLSTNFVL
jgi:hypothetical protein